MRFLRSMILAITALFTLLAAAPSFAVPPDSFAPIIEPLMPAVVNISTTQKVTQQVPAINFQNIPDTPQGRELQERLKQQFGAQTQSREITSLGSGFVIDESGYIVTNNHVIGNADAITIIFQDNKRLSATIVGRDAKTDLALLKVKPEKPLASVKFGDSDAIRVGDWVIAIGNPFGLGGSVSVGVVSARGRNINAGPFDDFIQIDAAINRGNSGGPLFNARGEVIGVNSAIFSPTGTNIGIGFAVPANMVKTIISGLREHGSIQRGWLGVKIAAVSDEVADSLSLGKARGALLADVTKGGPADKAGLTAGDVVLKFDGKDINEVRNLTRFVADSKVGKKAEITYWRKGHEEKTTVTVGDLPKETDPDDVADAPAKSSVKDSLVLGMRLVTITPQLRSQFNLRSDLKGVIVDAIDPGGEAPQRGVRPGDILVEINQSPVDSSDAVKSMITAAKKAGKNFVLLRVLRGNDLLLATVPLK